MRIQTPFLRLMTLLVLCVGLVLPIGSVSAAELPAGWKPQTVGEIQLGLPENWQQLPVGKAELQTISTQVAKNNPEFASLIQQLIDSGQYKLLKFFAIDLAKGQNVNVVITPVGVQLTPKQIVPVVEQQLKANIKNLTIVNTNAALTLNGLSAGRIEYTLGLNNEAKQTEQLTSVQYYVPIGTDIYVLTVTGSSAKGIVTLADQIAGTIQKPQSASSPTALVRASGNLREAPSTKGKIIEQVKAKETVTLLGRNKSSTWLRVTNARGVTGWVSMTLLNSNAVSVKSLKVVP